MLPSLQRTKPESGFGLSWLSPWPLLLPGSPLPSARMTAPAPSTPLRTPWPPIRRAGIFWHSGTKSGGQPALPETSGRCDQVSPGVLRVAQSRPAGRGSRAARRGRRTSLAAVVSWWASVFIPSGAWKVGAWSVFRGSKPRVPSTEGLACSFLHWQLAQPSSESLLSLLPRPFTLPSSALPAPQVGDRSCSPNGGARAPGRPMSGASQRSNSSAPFPRLQPRGS